MLQTLTIMSQRKKTSSKTVSQLRRPGDSATVAWMLTVITALACELLSLAAGLVARSLKPSPLGLFSDLTLFAALVIGTVSILMLGVVLRVREVPPPRVIIVGSVVIGLLPWLAALYLTI